jgi:O-antigen/teichoic acid export membrane protein
MAPMNMKEDHIPDPTVTLYLKKIAKGTGTIFIGIWISTMIGFFSSPVIGRLLGPELYGLVTLAFVSTTVVSTIGSLGLSGGIARHVSLFLARKEYTKVKGAIVSSLHLCILTSLILGGVLFLNSGWIATALFHDARMTTLIKIMCIAVPLITMRMILVGAIRGFQNMKYYVLPVYIVEPISRTVLIVIIVLILGYGVLGAISAYLLATFLAFITACYLFNKLYHLVRQMKFMPMYRELLSYSWPLIFTSLSWLLISWTDVLMLGVFRTSTEVGFYNAALPTARILGVVSTAFTLVFLPVLSELHAKEERRKMSNLYIGVTKWMFMLLLPLVLLMVFFPTTVLYILFGSLYTKASIVLSILASGLVINYLFTTTPACVLSTIGRTKFIGLAQGIAAVLNICLNYYLVPIYGIIGAAIATGISLVVGGTVMTMLAVYTTKLIQFNKAYLRISAAGFVSVILSFLIYNMVANLTGKSLHLLLSVFLIFFLTYFFTLIVFKCFDSNDIAVMKAIEKRVGIRFNWLRKLVSRFIQ